MAEGDGASKEKATEIKTIGLASPAAASIRKPRKRKAEVSAWGNLG